MSKEGKHHYIPVFYLKQWAGGDQLICEFSNPYNQVKARRIHPDGTGYVHGLNTIPGVPLHDAQYLENVFFKFTDNYAAIALRVLLSDPPWHFSPEIRSAWSRFLMSLIVRNPESVEKHRAAAESLFKSILPMMEAEYPKYRTARDPETYMEYSRIRSGNLAGRIFSRLLQSVIDSEFSGSRLNSMRWIVLHDPKPKHLLLTSDRPVVMTNGLDKPNGQLIIPISPRQVFVATNNPDTESYIRGVWRNSQLIQQVNERVALQSRKYVYGYSEAQLSFVSSRLGQAWTADPLENLSIDIPTRPITGDD
jgi:Protein of unknown function (DUF4238)